MAHDTRNIERKRSAVALTYAETDSAPRVVAKGHGLIAEQIIARAKVASMFTNRPNSYPS